MKTKLRHEPHLVLREITVPKSGEWRPRAPGWTFVHNKSGSAYWQDRGGAREFPAGSLLVAAAESSGTLRASQLSEVVVTHFSVDPENLHGLLTLGEQQSLKNAALRDARSSRSFSPGDPFAERAKILSTDARPGRLSTRLGLLQLCFDILEDELDERTMEPLREAGGRDRMRHSLKQMASSEFVALSLADLAPVMRCSPRHVSRLFRQETGASFREKQTELRMAKARELLANSNAKVVEVALTSGYHSYSLFADSFKRRFGISPAKWRRQHSTRPVQRHKQIRLPAL